LLAALALVTLFSYGTGILLGRLPEGRTRRLIFWSGVGINLSILFFFRYLPAWSDFPRLLVTLPDSTASRSPLLITIGVSYYVFQAISYLADVALETERPERHLGLFSLYLAFFPKLLQGPIERASDLLPQLRQPYRFDYEQARSGALQFIWGLFKKLVVADRLALYVNPVYNDVHSYSGVALISATLMYAGQIYLDFSGYTDMALGIGRLFNLRLTQNFNSPYLATSVADFWRRWHISFSRWILDYIFKPLQFSWRDWRTAGSAAALVVTFLFSGLWHGAAWGFVAWGGLHGVYLASSLYWRPYQKKMYQALGLEKSRGQRVLQTAGTFCLISFAWIFFRANSFGDAIYVVRHLAYFDLSRDLPSQLFLDKGLATYLVSIGGLLLVAAGPSLYPLVRLSDRPVTLRWAAYLALVFIVILGGVQEKTDFVYFQF
jgi:alginate O-acetyltransferase complex protein AlgI